jgi:hypothetical protein
MLFVFLIFSNSVNFFRYPLVVRYYHGTISGFLINGVLFLAVAKDFLCEFMWVSQYSKGPGSILTVATNIKINKTSRIC